MEKPDAKPTRYYSSMQEDHVGELVGGHRTPNSGAGHFSKGDVVVPEASLLIECKTPTSEKASVSIKKEWVSKNRQEALSNRLAHCAIAVEFAPNSENYFLIDESLFSFLVEKLREEYENV